MDRSGSLHLPGWDERATPRYIYIERERERMEISIPTFQPKNRGACENRRCAREYNTWLTCLHMLWITVLFMPKLES